MLSLQMYDALARERTRDRDERVQAAYLRRLTVARRRQRASDAAHRRLAALVVR